MEETNKQTENWVQGELAGTAQTVEYEKFPAPVFEENKLTTVVVDFSKPFQKWKDEETNKVKAIIPCTSNGVRCNWWLNTKNPVYRKILEGGQKGITTFTIMQTGKGNKTKYALVEK